MKRCKKSTGKALSRKYTQSVMIQSEAVPKKKPTKGCKGKDKETYLVLGVFGLLSVQNNWYSPELSTQAVTSTFLTPWAPPTTTHRFPVSSSFSLVLFHSHNIPPPVLPLSHLFPFLFLHNSFFVFRSFPLFLSLHVLHFPSLDPLMSAATCCRRPPVQISATQDQIQLNYAAVDRTGLKLTSLDGIGLIRKAGEKRGGGWDDTIPLCYGDPGYSWGKEDFYCK